MEVDWRLGCSRGDGEGMADKPGSAGIARQCLALVWTVREHRPCLHGRRLRVDTDHGALQWLLSLREPTHPMEDWHDGRFSCKHATSRLCIGRASSMSMQMSSADRCF